MGARTIARECGLMVLFAVDVSPADADKAVADFFRHIAPTSDIEADADARAYTEELVRGVAGDLAAIDKVIAAASTHWRIERMPRVDRNVLRIAAWELQQGVGRAVVIDEAVELAKRFGNEGSGAFVNGVLTKIADDVGAT